MSTNKRYRFVQMCRVCIFMVLGVGPIVWASFCSYGFLYLSPVSDPYAYSLDVALSNVLELQTLALSEAARGEQAFFIAYIGCPVPDVWQNPQVLENLKLMVEEGVEVKLIGSRRPFAHWSDQFVAKLLEYGMDPGIYAIGEMPNHSVVAGSNRRSRAYTCFPEADNIYPTKYFLVRDKKLCLAWKDYLQNAFVAAREEHMKQPN